MQALQQLAKHGTALDLKRLVPRLKHVDDPAQVFSLYSLLAFLALKDEANRKELIQISDVYSFANKILISGSIKKVNSVLNFLAAIIHSNDDAISSKDSNSICKTMIRTSGCLGQMCQLFLQSNIFDQSWKPLCICLAECCFDEPENKTFSSHILLKCLRQINHGYKLELVMLTRALIENFPPNQEKFVQLGGIKSLARNLLYKPEGVELLCVAITDCKMAVDEAIQSNLSSLLKCYQLRTPTDSKFAKWCQVALWKLNIKLPVESKCIPKIYILNENDTKDKFSAIDNDVWKASECKPSFPVFHTKDQQQSCISKFDAIFASDIENNNLLGDINPNSLNEVQNLSTINSTIFLPEKITNFLKRKKVRFNSLAEKKNNSETLKNRKHPDKENYWKKREWSPEKYDRLVAEPCQYSEFCPRYFSSPKKLKSVTNNCIPEVTWSQGYGHFDEFNKVTHIDVEDNLDADDDEMDQDVTLKCDETLSTTFKVRMLARNILDCEKRTQDVGNGASVIHVLSPDKINRLHVESIIKTKAPLTDIFRAVSKSQNGIGAFKSGKKYVNKKRDRENIHDNTLMKQKTKTNDEDPNCLSLEERFPLNISLPVKTEIMGKELDTMISLLKMGISLYGCNFQKISKLLWPKEDVSPVVLYEIFRLHIVNT